MGTLMPRYGGSMPQMQRLIARLCAVLVLFLFATSAFAQTNYAVLTAPTNGSVVSPVPSVQFTWNAVSNAVTYVLWVGTSAGAYDVAYVNTTALSTAVKGAPATTFYARLWTEVGTSWSYAPDVTFSSQAVAYITSPSSGATNV